MAVFKQILTLIVIFSTLNKSICIESSTSASESKEELVESESKDGKLEIIKQIKKVNDDGSYTIGYEADDGSFKIESRDVLGNIKGTYGYLDDNGEIKRVSYSTSNSSEVISKLPESSVVQRIPKLNRTLTTRRPFYVSSTIPSSTKYQKIIRNPSSTTSTTVKPNLVEIVEDYSKTTAAPRILLQGRPILRSTPSSNSQKSEGQLVRPETIRTTEMPLFRQLALKHLDLSSTAKPVIEQPEIKGNILRRQLIQDKSNFDPHQHVISLQQSMGNDATDVYSASVTTGTPRPLFTTTIRPRTLLSSTTHPTIAARPIIRYPNNYHKNSLQDAEASTTEYNRDIKTETSETTPSPVVQIPASRSQEPLVALRHPVQRGTILVPLSHVQEGRVVLDDNHYRQFADEQKPIYLRRIPPPHFRPIPVQVDENGYVREAPSQNIPTAAFSGPMSIAPSPRYLANDEVDNDIDQISPPVSTKDFQKLLQQLILRQTRLEKISALTDSRRQADIYQQPKYRLLYRPTSTPYFIQRYPENQQNGPVQFVSESRYDHPQPVTIRHQRQQHLDDYNQDSSFVPSKRMARILTTDVSTNKENEEYLPPDVREMLLLRMLQLAINPALPINDDEEIVEASTPMAQYKKAPVRNVEILGEENEQDKIRSRRY